MALELAERSRTLAMGYVFYQRLSTDGPQQKRLYDNVNNRLNRIGSNEYRQQLSKQAAANLLSMCKAEAAKESALLTQALKNPVNIDYTRENGADEAIRAINIVLGSKKDYIRNLTRMTKHNQAVGTVAKFALNTHGKKGKPEQLGYIQKHMEPLYNSKYRNDFTVACAQVIIGKKDSYTAASQVIENWLLEAVKLGLLDMLSSRTLKSKEYNDEELAYQEILDKMNSDEGFANSFVREFYEAIGFSSLKTNLEKMLHSRKDEVKSLVDIDNIARTAVNKSKTNANQNTGLGAEVFSEIVSQLALELKKNGNIDSGDFNIDFLLNSGVKRIGQLNFKPDIIATFGIDVDLIINKFEEAEIKIGEPTRRAAYDQTQKVIQELENFPEGFIVEQNLKTYWINSESWNSSISYGFGAGAYTGTEGLNFLSKIHNSSIGDSTDMLFTAIMNLGKNTIGQSNGELKQSLELQLAQDIGHALFDDHDGIGKQLNNASDRLIHVMELNGIKITLSFFYYLLYQAFSRMIDDLSQGDNIKELVSVNIQPAAADSSLYNKKLEEYTEADWIQQSNLSREQTKITMHFLHSFKEILNEYLKI